MFDVLHWKNLGIPPIFILISLKEFLRKIFKKTSNPVIYPISDDATRETKLLKHDICIFISYHCLYDISIYTIGLM